MALSTDLLSQFVKATKDDEPQTTGTIYGTIVDDGSSQFVMIDGSELLTPISSTTNMKDGDRVSVEIKNHTAIVTGNITAPSANTDDLDNVNNRIDQQGNDITQIDNTIYQQGNTITQIGNTITQLDNTIYQQGNTITQINNTITEIGNTVNSQGNTITQINDTVNSQNNKITLLDNNITQINSTINTQNSTIENLDTTIKNQGSEIYNINSSMTNLNSQMDVYNSSFKIENDVVTGLKGADLEWINVSDLLTAKNADIKYANIDFANIGKVAMEYFYAQSGLIKDVVVGDQTITGELIGVTIKGDLIEGNTVVADKLVIKGEDGLYYKLNTDGITTEAQQTDYNSLNGQVIRAKSITATKIAVEDLVAFDATIGGFSITDSAIYSGVKESVDNTTRGIYLDRTGQMAIGDAINYIKYYKDTDGSYKLAISARSVAISTSNKNIEEVVEEVQAKADAAIISTVEQYYQSDYPTTLSGGEWSIVQPIWTEGKYLWKRTKVTYASGESEFTPSEDGVCISGNAGLRGEDSTVLRIESSRGNIFKNDSVSTVLSVVIYHGSTRITDSNTMHSIFGDNAYLQWKWQRLDETSYSVISADDYRLGSDGFTFTLSPEDVNNKVTFICELLV